MLTSLELARGIFECRVEMRSIGQDNRHYGVGQESYRNFVMKYRQNEDKKHIPRFYFIIGEREEWKNLSKLWGVEQFQSWRGRHSQISCNGLIRDGHAWTIVRFSQSRDDYTRSLNQNFQLSLRGWVAKNQRFRPHWNSLCCTILHCAVKSTTVGLEASFRSLRIEMYHLKCTS